MEHHVPIIGGVGAVELAVRRTVERATVVDRVVRGLERIGCVKVNDTAISVVGIVQVRDAVVVVVPVDAVLEAVAVDVGIDVVGPVVSIQATVDLMQVVVVVKIAVPIDVQHVDDAVVVVVDVVPVADAVAVPIVELRERCSAGLAAWVRIDRVWVGLRRAVPRGDVGGCIKRERIVFVLDVVVVQIVRSVGTTHGKVAEVVGGGRTAHVRVKPVVNAVVVLVKRTADVIVEVVIVVNLAIDDVVVVAVGTGNLEVGRGDAGDGQVALGIASEDGDLVADVVARAATVDGGRRDGAAGCDDVHREARSASRRGGCHVGCAVVVCTAGGNGDAGHSAVSQAGVVAGLVAVGVDFNAGVQNAVVVVVGVNHVEDAVVVVVGVSRVRCTVVVVVRVQEVRNAVTVQIAVDDFVERRNTLWSWEHCRVSNPATGACTGGVHAVALPVNVVNAARVRTVFVERPDTGCVVQRRGVGHQRLDAGVVRVSVVHVENAVVVVVGVEVIGRSVCVDIAGPSELIDSTVVIVVLVVATGSCSVAVFVGDAVVVVVHRILVGEVEVANGTAGPRVDGRRVEIAIR